MLSLSPFSLSKKLKETLEDISNTEEELGLAENLHYDDNSRKLNHVRFSGAIDPKDSQEIINWYDWREQQGSVGRETKAFYDSVWEILHHCKGLMMGGKLNSKNRLDSENTLSQMTEGEQSFKLVVNHLLNKIQAPVYRQLTVEALKALALIFKENKDIQIDDTLLTDILIGHAVRLSWLQLHPAHAESYDEQVSSAWQAFYHLPPHKVANGILDALIYLLDNNQEV